MGVIPLTQCRSRAVGDALTAECALAGLEIIGILHIDRTLGTGVDDIPDMAVLHLITDLHAAHALDALVVIPDQREVQRTAMLLRQLLLKRDAQDVEVIRHLLQLTVSGAHTDRTVRIMLAEDQLHIRTSRKTCLPGVRIDDHALGHGVVAGGHQTLITLDLDDADSACRNFIDIL